MVLSMRGRKIHKYLVNKASKYFSDKGYTVFKEAKMSGKTRIDLLAIKGSEKIGIECQLTISHDIIKQKFRDYGPNLTKMILVVPMYRERKIKNVIDKIVEEEKISKSFFDVWTENVDVTTTIRISKKTKNTLDETARKIGKFRDTYDEVIEKLIEFYESKNNKKKK